MQRRKFIEALPLVGTMFPLIGAAQARPLPNQADHADRELIQLGNDLKVAWQAERDLPEDANDQVFEAAYKRCTTIVRDIERRRAETIEGLQTKAFAVNWCHSGEDICFNDIKTTDIRLAEQIVNDILGTRSPTAGVL